MVDEVVRILSVDGQTSPVKSLVDFVKSLFGLRQVGGAFILPFLCKSVQLFNESLDFSFGLFPLLEFLVDDCLFIHLFLWLLCSDVDRIASA